jgi:putative sterol carrier protein/predicted N-acetyltransferase YhbS
MRRMSGKNGVECRAYRCEDEEQVRALVKNVFGDFLDGEFWNWKYKSNPGFDPDLVMVAERDGTLVGCNHWLLKDFLLSPSMETKAVLGADIAVDPVCRSQGVGKTLLHSLRSSESVKVKQPSFVFMFADPSLAKVFHNPKGGYFPAPDQTAFYLKILNWKKLENNVRKFNEQIAAGKFEGRLSGVKLNVLFKISKSPRLLFSITERGIAIGEKAEDNVKNPDVTITADLNTLQKVWARKRRYLNMFKALLTGKLRVRGKPKSLMALYRNVWVLQEIFSQKIF